MSRVRARAYEIVTGASSDEELLRRRRAEGRRTGFIGGLEGEQLKPSQDPTQASRRTGWVADPDAID